MDFKIDYLGYPCGSNLIHMSPYKERTFPHWRQKRWKSQRDSKYEDLSHFEGNEKGPQAKVCGWSSKAENDPQPTVNFDTGTSVPQAQYKKLYFANSKIFPLFPRRKHRSADASILAQ